MTAAEAEQTAAVEQIAAAVQAVAFATERTPAVAAEVPGKTVGKRPAGRTAVEGQTVAVVAV